MGGRLELASIRPTWFRTRFVSSARTMMMNSTSGSRRLVVLSPCRKTQRCTRGGQARHEDHLLLEGGPVRVLGGTTLEGSGEETLRIHRLPHRVVRGEVEGEGSDRFGGR